MKTQAVASVAWPSSDVTGIARGTLAFFGLFGPPWGGGLAAAEDCQAQRAANLVDFDPPESDVLDYRPGLACTKKE